jgi:peroxiredoxin
VAAVVAQRSEKVRRYVEGAGLPFDILVDDTRETIKAYGVWQRIGLDAWNIARPALFLIDRAGIVRYSFVGSTQFEFPTQQQIMEEIVRLAASVLY